MTVRTVGLLRHATAAHDAPTGRDFDRELAPLGHKEMERVGRFLHAQALAGLRFDTILASPARRTWQTAHLAAEALGSGGQAIVADATIYEAHEADLARILDARPLASSLLLVGHNPAISELAQHLTGDERIRERGMTKAGLVLAQVDGAAVRGNVRSYRYATPKDLP